MDVAKVNVDVEVQDSATPRDRIQISRAADSAPSLAWRFEHGPEVAHFTQEMEFDFMTLLVVYIVLLFRGSVSRKGTIVSAAVNEMAKAYPL